MRLAQFLLLFFAFLVFLFSRSITDWVTDIWWFQSVGFESIFWKIFEEKSLLWISSFAAVFFFLYLNFQAVLWFTRFSEFKNPGQGGLLPWGEKWIRRMVTLGLLVLAFFFAQSWVDNWEETLRFFHSQPFAKTDPIFGHDISFYVFELPFIRSILGTSVFLLILTNILVLVLYLFRGAIRIIVGGPPVLSREVQIHITVLFVLLSGCIAFYFWLQRFELLYSQHGVLAGANYTDLHARIWAYWILAFIAVGIGLFLVMILIRKSLLQREIWYVGLSVGALFAAYIILQGIYPSLLQKFVVEPNELAKELPYIGYNLEYTRLAYDLDTVERKQYTGSGDLSQTDLFNNRASINNVRLWDWRPLLTTYKQLQEIRLYYNFNDVDLDRYIIGDQYRQVLVSARELNYDQVPAQAQTWVNQRLKYTHGYGLVLSPVNRVTSQGQPEFFTRDVPPKSEYPELNLKRPEIYYGEQTDHYVFTGTTTEEFDYPDGDNNKMTHYEGKGGVSLENFWKKIAYAYYFGSIKFFTSEYFSDSTRVHYFRNIRDRVKKIAPFLSLDMDPYPVISEGKIYWILDAYTSTDRYPYSKAMGRSGFNYVRNSVKVVVDAYDGSVHFFSIGNNDPILKTYASIFPDVFQPASEAPDSIRSHFRYASDLFQIQSEILLNYHMDDPSVFYNQEDLWKPATEIYEGREVRMEPYYVIMSLPEERNEEFLLIYPFTPSNKNNMISWLAARSDAKNYGKMVLYEFPKQDLVYGPMQIEARIDQNPEISQQLSLWNQQGSAVIRGNLLVLPIKDSLLYIEPLYLRSEQGQLPELKRVIVSYKDQIAMQETLEAALSRVFGSAPAGSEARVSTEEQMGIANLARKALNLFKESQQSLRSGDWTEYGKRQKDLESALEALNRQAVKEE